MREDDDFGRGASPPRSPLPLGAKSLEVVRDRSRLQWSKPDPVEGMWLMGFPDMRDPVVLLGLDLESIDPFVAAMVLDNPSVTGDLVRELGATRYGEDLVVSVALSLAERLDPVQLLHGVVGPIVDRLDECGAFARA